MYGVRRYVGTYICGTWGPGECSGNPDWTEECCVCEAMYVHISCNSVMRRKTAIRMDQASVWWTLKKKT